MAYDHEEQEQIDELKAWWTRYGNAITVGLILALLVIAGVQGWRWWTAKRAEDASVLYSAVSDAVRAKDAAKAKDAAAQLTDRYAKTGYAPRGALLFAKLLYDSGDRNGAKAQYTWVAEHAQEDELQAIARYRLAQVQLDEKQTDAALTTLDAKHPEAFDALYADLRGDVLVAANRPADARVAYETALSKLDPKSGYRNYVQVKHDAITGTDKVAASSSARPAQDSSKAPASAQPPTTSKDVAKSGTVGVAANDAGKGAPGAPK